MSSSYILESKKFERNKEEGLILMVNDNGVITADQETLQNLIMNRSDATVRVVRLSNLDKQEDITLIVDPPTTVPSSVIIDKLQTDSESVVSALSSKKILCCESNLHKNNNEISGQNITTMLELLSLKEKQNYIKHIVELDHCYTNKLLTMTMSVQTSSGTNTNLLNSYTSSDPKLLKCDSEKKITISSGEIDSSNVSSLMKSTVLEENKSSNQPASVASRPVRNSEDKKHIFESNNCKAGSQCIGGKVNDKGNTFGEALKLEENDTFYLSESSESLESDNDCDFGPRYCKKVVRSRHFRRIVTRGGLSRRPSNKSLDNDQMKKSDSKDKVLKKANEGKCNIKKHAEYAVKSSEILKDDNENKQSLPTLQSETVLHFLKEENQKLNNKDEDYQPDNLKYDCSLSNNMDSAPEDVAKTSALKLETLTSRDGSPVLKKQILSSVVTENIKELEHDKDITVREPLKEFILSEIDKSTKSNQNKSDTIQLTKEDKIIDTECEAVIKNAKETAKHSGLKTDILKKCSRRDHRKSDGHEMAIFGPALFSAPDIIRRVSAAIDSKLPEYPNVNSSVDENKESLILHSDFLLMKSISNNSEDSKQIDLQKEQFLSASNENCSEELTRDSKTSIKHENRFESEEVNISSMCSRELGEGSDKIRMDRNPIVGENSENNAGNVKEIKGNNRINSSRSIIKEPAQFMNLSNKMDLLQQPESHLLSTEVDVKGSSKSPVKFGRSSRVINLPPMEAPTTRSKKQQNHSFMQVENSLNNSELTEKKKNFEQEDMVGSNVNEQECQKNGKDEEDDPNRLWCLCKQPHNNRFMICCDLCQDWFHGKCVGVTKFMGEQMEVRGEEWHCPNCKKKDSDIMRKSLKKKQKKSQGSKVNLILSPNKDRASAKVTRCVVCKKDARNSSIYCSDACILLHAEVTKGKSLISQQDIKICGSISINSKQFPQPQPCRTSVDSSNLKQETLAKKSSREQLVKYTQPQGFDSDDVTKAKKCTNDIVINQEKSTLSSKKNNKIFAIDHLTLTRSESAYELTDNGSKNSLSHGIKKIGLPESGSFATKEKFIPYNQLHSLENNIPITKEFLQTTTEIKQLCSNDKDAANNSKNTETYSTRCSVRKTLSEALRSRIMESDQLSLSNGSISELSANIEAAMYKHFKDTGSKYKSKYRSLLFNIRDPKNLTLYKKIASSLITPEVLVTLSPEEMASQELAEWREKENKHQLEMIKRTELDLMTQGKLIVLKTHKGEEIIENDKNIGHVDPKTPVQDIVNALNSGNEDTELLLPENHKSKQSKTDSNLDLVSYSRKHRLKSKEKRKDKCYNDYKYKHSNDKRKKQKSSKRKNKDKNNKRRKYKEKQRSHNKHSQKELLNEETTNFRAFSEKVLFESECEALSVEDKSIEERLWRHIEDVAINKSIEAQDSDVSDREPSSTVHIMTPDTSEEIQNEKEFKSNHELYAYSTVWQGVVNMVDVAKFFITAQDISGHGRDLSEDIPNLVNIVGRIIPQTVWDYLDKMKRNVSKEIILIRLTATNDEEKIPYFTLYSYLNSRNRLGVVDNVSKNIKDFYIMPFSNSSQLPSVLLPIHGVVFEENRPHLLLGIIVYNKRKRLTSNARVGPSSKILKILTERSYTPPPVKTTLEKNLAFCTNKLSTEDMLMQSNNIVETSIVKAELPVQYSSNLKQNKDNEPYSPGEPVEVGKNAFDKSKRDTLSVINETDLHWQVQELNRKIEEKKQQIQDISFCNIQESGNSLPASHSKSNQNLVVVANTGSKHSLIVPTHKMDGVSSPLLEKVSRITLPNNLPEILANIKRQQCSQSDAHLPIYGSLTYPIPSIADESCNTRCSLLPTAHSAVNILGVNTEISSIKESKSTLSSLSDADLIKKAEEQFAVDSCKKSDSISRKEDNSAVSKWI